MSDLFISYAHEDAPFVERLQGALTARGRDVWVDTAGIEPADRWRTSAHEAIERSDALLFVISAHSLRSAPCLGELEHATSLNKRVIPVCVDQAAAELDKPAVLDELSWIMLRPGDDFEAGVTAVLRALDTDLEVVRTHTRILVRAKAWELAGRRASPLLRGEELRLAERWLASAAASKSPPTQLQQDFIAASQRAATRRLRILAALASGVAAVAIGLSIFALVQRSRAVQQASLATSRQLAAVSETELATNLDVALLLAVRAYRTDPNLQTRAALLQADLYSPRLARFLPLTGAVAALSGSADQSTVVAGMTDGRVMRWLVGARRPARLASLAASVTSIAVSASGSSVVAANGTRGVLWRAGAGVTPLACGGGQAPDAVGISPSGATVVVHCRAPLPGTTQSVEVVNGSSGTVGAVHPSPARFGSPSVVVVPSDAQVLLFDGAIGPWQQRQIPSWTLAASSSGTLGVHQALAGYSNDGRFVSATNNDPTIPVWSTSTPTDLLPSTAPLNAQAPLSAATALTVSPGGSEVGVADSGTIYVGHTAPAGTAAPSPRLLAGQGSINRDALRFLGDGAHLVSASGGTVALWNLTQFDRLARSQATTLPSPCEGCGGALAAVSPDGRRLAAVADDGTAAVLQSLAASGRAQRLVGYDVGPPLWDHHELLLPLTSSAGAGPGASPIPAGVRLLASVRAQETIVADALTDRGRSVTVVSLTGDVFVQDAGSGRVLRVVRRPRDLRSLTFTGLQPGMAAISAAPALVAIVDRGVVRLTDPRTGASAGRLPGADAGFVAFAGHRLLVQRTDGRLEVWDARGRTRQRVIAGDQSYGFYPVADPRGQLVARQRSDGSVTLADLNSGATLATLSAPASPSLGLRIGLTFAPDGQSLVMVAQTVAGDIPEIIRHPLGARTLVQSACASAGRNLTPAEWRTYVGTTPPSDLACH